MEYKTTDKKLINSEYELMNEKEKQFDKMKIIIQKQEELIIKLESEKAMGEFILSDELKYIEIILGGRKVLLSNKNTGIDKKIINLLYIKLQQDSDDCRREYRKMQSELIDSFNIDPSTITQSYITDDDGK